MAEDQPQIDQPDEVMQEAARVAHERLGGYGFDPQQAAYEASTRIQDESLNAAELEAQRKKEAEKEARMDEMDRWANLTGEHTRMKEEEQSKADIVARTRLEEAEGRKDISDALAKHQEVSRGISQRPVNMVVSEEFNAPSATERNELIRDKEQIDREALTRNVITVRADVAPTENGDLAAVTTSKSVSKQYRTDTDSKFVEKNLHHKRFNTNPADEMEAEIIRSPKNISRPAAEDQQAA